MKNILLLSSIVGIFSVNYLTELPSINFLICFSPCLLFIRYLCLSFISYGYIGFCYAFVCAVFLINDQLPEELDRKEAIVTGTVIGLPDHQPDRTRFTFKISSIKLFRDKDNLHSGQQIVGDKFLLSWYQYSEKALVKTGEKWTFHIKMKRPRGFVNPHGFDYHLWLLKNQFSATAYIKESSINRRHTDKCNDLMLMPNCWREAIRDNLKERKGEYRLLGPILALMIGDRSEMTDAEWLLLKETGTIHLMAISGLHIGLAAFFGHILGSIIRNISILLVKNNTSCAFFPIGFSLFFAVTYSLMSGLSIPTQRALMAITVFLIFSIVRRSISAFTLFLIVVLLVALSDPMASLKASFWLSFSAVGILLIAFVGYQQSSSIFLNKLKPLLKSQWVIMVGLIPVSALWIGGISLSAFLANLLIIPYVSFLVVPTVLLALFVFFISKSISFWLLEKTDYFLSIGFDYLIYLTEKLPGFFTLESTIASFITVLLGFVFVMVFLMPRKIISKYLLLLLFLPVFYPQRNDKDLELTVLDVGQGLSVVVETLNHTLVYDTGQRFSDRLDTGRDIVAPYLLGEGRHQAEILIVSHDDNDHAGGVGGLIERIEVQDVLVGQPDKNQGMPCQKGMAWVWDDVFFSILWPVQNHTYKKDNNASCVVLIEYRDKKILLTGDIEKEIEARLLSELTHIDVLLVPHHGSKTSSHGRWVKNLSPDYAIFSSGYKNHYRHPNVNVVKRYESQGSQLFSTAIDGAVKVFFNKNGLSIEGQRTLKRRYWYDLVSREKL